VVVGFLSLAVRDSRMGWDDENEEEPFQVKLSAQTRWKDEDKENKDVRESWEDDMIEKPENLSTPTNGTPMESSAATHSEEKSVVSSMVPPKKTKSKGSKIVASNDDSKSVVSLTKIQQQQLVERADFQNMQDLFSGIQEAVDITNPKNENDYEALASVLAQKIISLDKGYYYKGFLKSLFKQCTQNLKPEDIKELSSTLLIVANERLKAGREKEKKKKKTIQPKKPLAKDDGLGGEDIYYDEAEYDDDFM